MGHLGFLKDEYRDLVHRLEGGQVGFPEPADPTAREGWREILEILYTPEEAALASRLPIAPAGLDQIAARVGMPAGELRPKLEALCDRGVVMDLVHPRTGEAKYLLSPPVIGFFEFSLMRASDGIPKKRMAEALQAYTHGDDAFALEVFGGDTQIGRSLVHETALGDDQADVLDWERATSVVRDASAWSVALCYCRHKMEHLGKRCDAPMDVCLSLNEGAKFVARRKFGRAIERSEALDLLVKSRESGLVQIADNVQQRPTFICNCCGCCCGQLEAINRLDLHAVNPSGFYAKVRMENCVGCSRCARACPIASIAMKPVREEARRRSEIRPEVDLDRCIGCGVCADACGKDAMHMARREAMPYVPQNSIERALRMAIERGHLGELLCDGATGRGARFLGAVFKALLALPGAQRLMASEQVKSRFVRAALARIQDPTGG